MRKSKPGVFFVRKYLFIGKIPLGAIGLFKTASVCVFQVCLIHLSCQVYQNKVVRDIHFYTFTVCSTIMTSLVSISNISDLCFYFLLAHSCEGFIDHIILFHLALLILLYCYLVYIPPSQVILSPSLVTQCSLYKDTNLGLGTTLLQYDFIFTKYNCNPISTQVHILIYWEVRIST